MQLDQNEHQLRAKSGTRYGLVTHGLTYFREPDCRLNSERFRYAQYSEAFRCGKRRSADFANGLESRGTL